MIFCSLRVQVKDDLLILIMHVACASLVVSVARHHDVRDITV